MSDQNYFEKDAISATLLKAIIKQSPVHAEERMKSFEPTANMKLGTAFHAIMLEPENYGDLKLLVKKQSSPQSKKDWFN